VFAIQITADKSLLRVHVLPAFGDRKLAAVDRVAARQWVAELESSGMDDALTDSIHAETG
jgi:hypothetical protein